MIVDLPIAKARLEKNFAKGGYDVHVLVKKFSNGDVEVLCPIVPPCIRHFVAAESMISEGPAFQLSEESAQALLDSLYEAGLRPSSGASGVITEKGQELIVTLMKNHIADLRRVAFGPPEPELFITADTPRTYMHKASEEEFRL